MTPLPAAKRRKSEQPLTGATFDDVITNRLEQIRQVFELIFAKEHENFYLLWLFRTECS